MRRVFVCVRVVFSSSLSAVICVRRDRNSNNNDNNSTDVLTEVDNNSTYMVVRSTLSACVHAAVVVTYPYVNKSVSFRTLLLGHP